MVSDLCSTLMTKATAGMKDNVILIVSTFDAPERENKTFENIVRKEENVGNQEFSFTNNCFHPISRTCTI